MEPKKSWFVRLRSKVFGFCPDFRTSPAYREKYRSAVTKLADNWENRRFLNGEEWDAEIVVGLMVSRATEKDELLIYSDSLAPKYYAKILRDSNCRIRILLGNPSASDFISSLPQDVQERIDFRVVYAPCGKHLLTVGNSVRCEVNDDGNELFMVSNFYEPAVAQRLRDRFEAMWGKSPPWRGFLY